MTSASIDPTTSGGAAADQTAHRVRTGPVFVVGRFRSGSTMVWQLFRQQPGWTTYLEPLHEHLLGHVAAEPGPVDPTHLGVSDYWREYRALPRTQLEALARPWFGRSRFRLRADDVADDLAAYVGFLVASAPRVMLKFTRAEFRTPWLRHAFPDATIVQLIRSPRALWTSSLGRSHEGHEQDALAAGGYGTFLAYHEAIAADIGLHVDGHPYRRFYAHSLLAAADALAHVDDTWRYEDIVADPRGWADRHQLFAADAPATTSRLHSRSVAARFHTDDWYDAHEHEVARWVIEQGVSEQVLGWSDADRLDRAIRLLRPTGTTPA